MRNPALVCWSKFSNWHPLDVHISHRVLIPTTQLQIANSVNANKRHFYKASQVLAGADRDWLSRLVTRREPPERFAAALERGANDIKTVVQFSDI